MSFSLIATYPIILPLAVTAVLLLYNRCETRKLQHIPTPGYSSPLFSYISAIKFMLKGGDMIQEGYNKYNRGVFKVPLMHRWLVIASGDDLQELKSAPDNVLSAEQATEEFMQVSYTMGPEIATNRYHVAIVRTHLTRNIPKLIPALKEELVASFEELIPQNKEWVKFNANDAFTNILVRITNRVLVGLPLCRDEEYRENAHKYGEDLVTAAISINLVPPFLRPLIRSALKSHPTRINRALEQMKPVIDQYRKEMEDGAEQHEFIFLKWLIAEAEGAEQEDLRLTRRVMLINFGTIHTTTVTFLHALYYIAANPSYVKPLREEVEKVVSEGGWSKDSLDRLHKIDSFIREAQRLHPFAGFIGTRKALSDYTFKNGTFIPKGTMVAAAPWPTQTNNEVYSNPYDFDPLRFCKMNDNLQGDHKVELVTLTNDLLSFGVGKHACPGRFFAAAELKMMLSHVVLNYDVKFENEGVRPQDVVFGPSRMPDPKAEIMFKRRVNSELYEY